MFANPSFLLVFLLGALSLGCMSHHESDPQNSQNYQYLRQWGKFSDDGILSYPYGIAMSPSGTIYVADRGNQRVQAFDRQLAYSHKIDSDPQGTAYFYYPRKIAAASDGSIYVADDTDKIQVFDSNGVYRFAWGGLSSDQRSSISGMAVDSLGNLFVAYGGMCQIRKFNSHGTLINSWGSQGAGDNQFSRLTELTIGPSDQVYVADSGKCRIVVFDTNGTYRSSFPVDEYDTPWCLAADSTGHVYVGQYNSCAKYDLTGTLLARWGDYGGYEGIAITTDGSIVAAANNRLQKFDDSGRLLAVNKNKETGVFSGSAQISFEEPGSVFVGDSGSNRVQVFDNRGAFRFELPGSACIRATKTTFLVIDNSIGRIREVDQSGISVSVWGNYPSNPQETPMDLCRDRDGNVYVLDYYSAPISKYVNYRVQKFTQDGTFLALIWEGTYYLYAIDQSPGGFFVDDLVYITEKTNCIVKVYNLDGTLLRTFGGRGANTGSFADPEGLFAGPDGSIYICDTGNNRIQVFDRQGTFLDAWGGYGTGPGQFNSPSDICVDSDGNIYVFDRGNYRVQVFSRRASR